jgi:putative FmdB family regulatory protein
MACGSRNWEWRCQDCGSKFELLTSYDKSLAEMVCTKCHSTNVRKLLSVFAHPARSGSEDFGDFGGSGLDSGLNGGLDGGLDDGDSEDLGGGDCRWVQDKYVPIVDRMESGGRERL